MCGSFFGHSEKVVYGLFIRQLSFVLLNIQYVMQIKVYDSGWGSTLNGQTGWDSVSRRVPFFRAGRGKNFSSTRWEGPDHRANQVMILLFGMMLRPEI